jgi:hypothetical protein
VRPPAPRPRRWARTLEGAVPDALILVGCGAVTAAAWLVDLRLGLLIGGTLLAGLGYATAPPPKGPGG